MSKITLKDGQDIVLLTENSVDYLNPSAVVAGATFTLRGAPVTPVVAEVESDGDQEVAFIPSVYVEDNLGHRYLNIVGPRPKSRARIK